MAHKWDNDKPEGHKSAEQELDKLLTKKVHNWSEGTENLEQQEDLPEDERDVTWIGWLWRKLDKEDT